MIYGYEGTNLSYVVCKIQGSMKLLWPKFQKIRGFV